MNNWRLCLLVCILYIREEIIIHAKCPGGLPISVLANSLLLVLLCVLVLAVVPVSPPRIIRPRLHCSHDADQHYEGHLHVLAYTETL